MEDQRNFANIERRLEPGGDGQQLQQFMSDSPWSALSVYQRIQDDIREDPRLQEGGVLIVDETADAKAGECSAGAARQHNGRMGKVDLCRVATCLSFVHPASGVWTRVDDELFLPEHWFSPEHAELRQGVGVPADRTFQTKPQLALAMIERAVQQGQPQRGGQPICLGLSRRAPGYLTRSRLPKWPRRHAAGCRLAARCALACVTASGATPLKDAQDCCPWEMDGTERTSATSPSAPKRRPEARGSRLLRGNGYGLVRGSGAPNISEHCPNIFGMGVRIHRNAPERRGTEPKPHNFNAVFLPCFARIQTCLCRCGLTFSTAILHEPKPGHPGKSHYGYPRCFRWRLQNGPRPCASPGRMESWRCKWGTSRNQTVVFARSL